MSITISLLLFIFFLLGFLLFLLSVLFFFFCFILFLVFCKIFLLLILFQVFLILFLFLLVLLHYLVFLILVSLIFYYFWVWNFDIYVEKHLFFYNLNILWFWDSASIIYIILLTQKWILARLLLNCCIVFLKNSFVI